MSAPVVRYRLNGSPCGGTGSAGDHRVRDRDGPALLGLGQRLVLAVVALALVVRDEQDAVAGVRTGGGGGGAGGAGPRSPPPPVRGGLPPPLSGGVDALLLEALDG